MNHLSGMDAMFLHVESAEMPMHVGSLNVLDLPEGYSGEFFEDVKKHMAQRLHLAAVFTRKLALMPFDLANPAWVEDDDIDLDHHIRHVTLPKPGSNRQLQQVVARMHSSLMDRSRPLWEMVIIDGLKSGEVALYTKAHHAGIDGQAGVELARALFDLTAEGRAIRPPRLKIQRHQYQLGMAELAGAALRNTAHQVFTLAKMLPDMGRAARSLVPARNAAGKRDWKLRELLQMIPPRTPLNVAITNQRSFVGRTVPVAEIKEIAQALNVSFNDVVMATTSGALRRFLSASDELPAKSMTAAAPVSLREAGDATSNNQVSMLVMDLATNEPDRLTRLRKISAVATQRKATMNNLRAAIPMDFPMLAAPWLMSGLASMYGRSRLANVLPPAANVLISNVQGIPVPLYFAGAKIVSYYPVSIPSHGMALNVTVQSYNGRLDYGLIACRRALPDAHLGELGDDLLAEHRALLELARQAKQEQAGSVPAGEKAATVKTTRKKAATPTAKRAKAAVANKPLTLVPQADVAKPRRHAAKRRAVPGASTRAAG